MDLLSLLDYLEESVPLVQTKGVSADQLKFFLDPLAEYLAALYLIEHSTDNQLWINFLQQAKSDSTGASRSFVKAVLDCAKELSDESHVSECNMIILSELAMAQGVGGETQEIKGIEASLSPSSI